MLPEGVTIESFVAENGRAGILIPFKYADSLALLHQVADFDDATPEEIIDRINQTAAIAVLGIADGSVVGFLHGSFFGDSSNIIGTRLAYVDESFRRRGIFTALVTRFDEDATHRTPAYAIDDTTWEDHVARTLVEHHGYSVVEQEGFEISLRKILKPELFDPNTSHRK